MPWACTRNTLPTSPFPSKRIFLKCFEHTDLSGEGGVCLVVVEEEMVVLVLFVAGVVKVASMLVAVELDGVVTARRGRAVVVGRLGLGVAGPS